MDIAHERDQGPRPGVEVDLFSTPCRECLQGTPRVVLWPATCSLRGIHYTVKLHTLLDRRLVPCGLASKVLTLLGPQSSDEQAFYLQTAIDRAGQGLVTGDESCPERFPQRDVDRIVRGEVATKADRAS